MIADIHSSPCRMTRLVSLLAVVMACLLSVSAAPPPINYQIFGKNSVASCFPKESERPPNALIHGLESVNFKCQPGLGNELNKKCSRKDASDEVINAIFKEYCKPDKGGVQAYKKDKGGPSQVNYELFGKNAFASCYPKDAQTPPAKFLNALDKGGFKCGPGIGHNKKCTNEKATKGDLNRLYKKYCDKKRGHKATPFKHEKRAWKSVKYNLYGKDYAAVCKLKLGDRGVEPFFAAAKGKGFKCVPAKKKFDQDCTNSNASGDDVTSLFTDYCQADEGIRPVPWKQGKKIGAPIKTTVKVADGEGVCIFKPGRGNNYPKNILSIKYDYDCTGDPFEQTCTAKGTTKVKDLKKYWNVLKCGKGSTAPHKYKKHQKRSPLPNTVQYAIYGEETAAACIFKDQVNGIGPFLDKAKSLGFTCVPTKNKKKYDKKCTKTNGSLKDVDDLYWSFCNPNQGIRPTPWKPGKPIGSPIKTIVKVADGEGICLSSPGRNKDYTSGHQNLRQYDCTGTGLTRVCVAPEGVKVKDLKKYWDTLECEKGSTRPHKYKKHGN